MDRCEGIDREISNSRKETVVFLVSVCFVFLSDVLTQSIIHALLDSVPG